MRIKFKADIQGNGWKAVKGDELDLPRTEAVPLVQDGWATEVEVGLTTGTEQVKAHPEEAVAVDPKRRWRWEK